MRNRTKTEHFWQQCDGFSRISKMAQPDHDRNNKVITGHAGLLQPPSEVTV